jgi:hypothetical protein
MYAARLRRPHQVDDYLVNDLRIAFDCLWANGVKPNPEKCVFRVPRGMLLWYIVSRWGIEPNPKKVAVLNCIGLIRDLKGSRRCWGALPPFAASSRGLTKRACPSTGS